MVFSMSTMLVLALPTLLLAQRGSPTQRRTSMEMAAETLMKTQMMTVMDSKMQQMTVQPLSETRHSALMVVLIPMEICGLIPPTTVQPSMVTQQRVV